VRQVGHLQRLYRDARSTEHKILSRLNFFLLCGEILKRNVDSSFKTLSRGIIIAESSF
jgi:hypothetical protein